VPLLEARNLSLYFGGLPAVRNVDLALQEKKITGLIGPNGAGKTTLFNLISGFLNPSSGTVFYRDEIISGLPPHGIARRGIVRTYQKTSIFPGASVFTNITIGTHLWTKSGLWDALCRTSRSRKEIVETERKAREVLEFMELTKYEHSLAKNLPYGEQRRLEIAIAMACNPQLLLLDEPAAGMNPEETVRLMETIRKIRDRGITILLVEHDMKMVMGVCERIVVLNYGEKIAEGTPKEITENPEVIKVYLGDETGAADR
jgi:branched-chain amino acid transport system ATP-binding protein